MPPPPRLQGGERAASGMGSTGYWQRRARAAGWQPPLSFGSCTASMLWGRVSCRASAGPQQSHGAGACWGAMADRGGQELSQGRCGASPQAALPTASRVAVTRDAGQAVGSLSVPGLAVLLARSQAAAVGSRRGTSRASGREGRARLGLLGFPVTLMCSLARWSCRHPHGPSPCRNRMRRSPLLCPHRPPLSFAGTQVPLGSKFSSQPEGNGFHAALTCLPPNRSTPLLRVTFPWDPSGCPAC